MFQRLTGSSTGGGGGGGSDIQMNLLWTNDAPTENFIAKTISKSKLNESGFNYDDYTYFVIVTKRRTTEDSKPRQSTIIKKNTANGNVFVLAHSDTSSNATNGYRRTVTANNNGITISTAYSCTLATTTNACVPLYIYGLKCSVLDDVTS